MSRRVFNLDVYSDRELVHVLDDVKDGEGWTTALDVAARAGIGEENAASVSVRLSWMRRYGIVEKGKGHPAKWRLTQAGEEMLAGATSVPHSVKTALLHLKDSEIVAVSHTLTGRFRKAAAPHAIMTRREWQREIAKRGTK